MQTQAAIRTASPRQPAAQLPNGPLPRSRPRAEVIALMGTVMPFARNSEIYGENEPAEYLYKVISGTVRTYKVLVDGRRQISAFHAPGVVFGFVIGDEHTFSAEEFTDCKIAVIKRTALMAAAARDNEVARYMWGLTTRELQRAQAHTLLLIKGAQERVATFLLEMAEQVPTRGTVELAMSRQDIADYLGLTIDTVSRTLNKLGKTATIELSSARRIVLRDHSALSRLNS